MYRISLAERFISVQKAQMGIFKVCQQAERDNQFVRIMKNNQPVGVLLPDRIWQKLLQDMSTLDRAVFLERNGQGKREQSSKQLQLFR